jgi:hypothetical protein
LRRGDAEDAEKGGKEKRIKARGDERADEDR